MTCKLGCWLYLNLLSLKVRTLVFSQFPFPIMEFLAILLAYCTGPDRVHPDPAALDRLENARESRRSILRASGLSHMTQPIGELWCALTSLQAYINHFGMKYVEAQAVSIEIPLSSCAPSSTPAPLWAIWHEPNVQLLSAELTSSIAVLRELQLVDEHPLLDRSLLVILSVRGYLPPPIEEGI